MKRTQMVTLKFFIELDKNGLEQGWANIFYGGPHARITYITSIITLKP